MRYLVALEKPHYPLAAEILSAENAAEAARKCGLSEIDDGDTLYAVLLDQTIRFRANVPDHEPTFTQVPDHA